ncbi:hypothetical protein P3339_16890 [Microbulbifer sp. MLAF003]|uniref:hypothetical protein n=1 Tax=Microbulbifer sp. MLAF003 TaxID=3032582 RepID=UPI0024AD070B|nr:hypothetical protein [Microbulbifer sp. MLAF003]WHI50108.1 hypothetical protein P3339_16890 [Microbulbifer sp. MLAF003]
MGGQIGGAFGKNYLWVRLIGQGNQNRRVTGQIRPYWNSSLKLLNLMKYIFFNR